VFTLDKSKTPRLWSPRENIPAAAREARGAAAHVLAQLSVLRPWSPQGDPSAPSAAAAKAQAAALATVEEAVMRLAAQGEAGEQQDPSSSDASSSDAAAMDILSAASWPGIDEGQVLLQPQDVRTSWRELMSSSNIMVQQVGTTLTRGSTIGGRGESAVPALTRWVPQQSLCFAPHLAFSLPPPLQAMAAQQANKLASNRAPPLWAILAILVLGWNEFVGLIYNPFWLILVREGWRDA
jgi:hypothetical protein